MAQDAEVEMTSWSGKRNTVRDIAVKYGKKWVFQLLVFVLLLDFSFIFMYPVLYVAVTALKAPADLLDQTVVWVPNFVHWKNFTDVMDLMFFWDVLSNSLTISVSATIGSVVSCAMAGYALARYRFPGATLLAALLLIILVVPPQTTVISNFIQFFKYGWLNTAWPLLVPAFFGQGIKASLFILIFRQFFKNIPEALSEAARIDGAGGFRIFARIMLPLSLPATLVVSIFTFVWTWNDVFQSSMYLTRQELYTFPMALKTIIRYNAGMSTTGLPDKMMEPTFMAGGLLAMLPLVILFIVAQRYFTKGIERTGLVE